MRRAFMLFLLPTVLASALPAQQVTGGVTAGAVTLANGATQSDLNAVLGVAPVPWLSVTATLSRVHLSEVVSGSTATSNGFGDLPISLAIARGSNGGWSPEFGAALDVSIPTGNSACGLGTGTTGFGADVGIGGSPNARTRLAASASRELSGTSGVSALSPSHATSLAIEAAYALTPRWTTSLSLSGDLGAADSTQSLGRAIGAGARYELHQPLALTFDMGRGLTSGGSKWAIAIGFGTTFGGNNPVSGDLSSRRLSKVNSPGAGRGHGTGNAGKTTTCG